jgi:hypothetical protein
MMPYALKGIHNNEQNDSSAPNIFVLVHNFSFPRFQIEITLSKTLLLCWGCATNFPASGLLFAFPLEVSDAPLSWQNQLELFINIFIFYASSEME